MRLTIFALSLASLCVPGIALAQSNTTGTMTTTPGVNCSGNVSSTNCTLDNTQNNGRQMLRVARFAELRSSLISSCRTALQRLAQVVIVFRSEGLEGDPGGVVS